MQQQLIDNLHHLILFIGIIIITMIVAWLVNRFYKRLIQQSTTIMQNDPTNYYFLGYLITALIYISGFSAAIYTVPSLRAFASSLLAGAGILAVAVGFASQHALSNIISGLFIVIFKPFRINDRLQLQELSGIVEDITLRHTVIKNFENRRIIIPNAKISDEILINSNFSEERICKWMDVNISFDSDIDLAKKLMQEEAEAHPFCIDVRTPEDVAAGKPIVSVRVLSLGEYAVHLRAWVWAANSPDGFVMSCDLYERIKKRFDKEGIEIPFPYRTIVYKEKPLDRSN